MGVRRYNCTDYWIPASAGMTFEFLGRQNSLPLSGQIFDEGGQANLAFAF